jgi:hypothetical protein
MRATGLPPNLEPAVLIRQRDTTSRSEGLAFKSTTGRQESVIPINQKRREARLLP